MEKKILLIHQNAELYGSDRTFEQTVRGYRQTHPEAAITVVLPFAGPLVAKLKGVASRVLIKDLLVIRRGDLKSGRLLKPWRAARLVWAARRLIAASDVAYINTAVVLDFIIASRLVKRPCILHVHELPSGATGRLLRLLIRIFKGTIICNSLATQRAYALKGGPEAVILNGVREVDRRPLVLDNGLRILVLGRFNAGKGQEVLLHALPHLPDAQRARVRVRLVGGVFQGQEHFREAVVQVAAACDLADKVEFYDFAENPAVHYQWANLVVVPSLLPESFGLVAVEAMAHGRPVVAANHGGLVEIVEEGRSGFLFPPGDSCDLAQKLSCYLNQPELLQAHGEYGRARFQDLFREERYMQQVVETIDTRISGDDNTADLASRDHSAASGKNSPALLILGCRGIPAQHGGFETFAEYLSLHLAGKGWAVTVYCQEEGNGPMFEDEWRGVRRIRIPVSTSGAAGTIIFDWKSTLHAAQEPGLVLTLGYNTALFCALYRWQGRKNIINMDGVEWRRQKWGAVARAWLWGNEWLGCWLGNHLVADHPEIKRHLATRVRTEKITMIPYGSERVETADPAVIAPYGLASDGYAILIVRAEPENSILEVVRAWSRRPRGCKLVVLGRYEAGHAYQRAVKAAASAEVLFPGAIYEKETVQALRFFSRFYIHGHRVGGTNPSLVEALGAGNAVLAHDNPYNRWVAEAGGVYFRNEEECATQIELLLADGAVLEQLRAAGRARHAERFTWDRVLAEYETVLTAWS